MKQKATHILCARTTRTPERGGGGLRASQVDITQAPHLSGRDRERQREGGASAANICSDAGGGREGDAARCADQQATQPLRGGEISHGAGRVPPKSTAVGKAHERTESLSPSVWSSGKHRGRSRRNGGSPPGSAAARPPVPRYENQEIGV